MALVPFPGARHPGVPESQDPGPDDDLLAEDSGEAKMSFLEHLDELRARIVRSVLAVAVGIAATFAFIQPIFNFLLAPTRRALPPGIKLIYTQPGEAFSLYVTVALIAGVVVAAPFIMYQVWMFIAPGLYSHERRMAYPFVALTTIGFLLGAAFNHYVAFPFMMVFFASFNSPELGFMPRLDDVFGLYTKMLLGMGIVFQMPAVVYFLAKMKLVTASFLWKNGKYAILLAYVAAAIITPTGDPFNQTIFAAPIIALYFISILIAALINPRRKTEQTEA
jgi:sec-independent protein translocase protein TatC